MIKITLTLWLLGAAAGFVAAQDNTPITANGVDIRGLVKHTRAGIWLPWGGGQTYKTIYTPLIWLRSTAGVEYAALNFGAAAPDKITQGYAFAAIGLRVDNILDRALGLSPWIKQHVATATLPSMEAGAGPLLVDGRIKWGASLAVKF